jgi:TP901 family phage tail tape measure protein
MARDKIEVELLLNAKRAEATIRKMNRELDKMGKSMSRGFSGVGGGGGSDKVRALGTGLSKATVRADEFTKSLEASNARVIAFGASAGLIMNIDKALRAMVSSAIKVEKAMADVNVVMNVTTKQLDKFGKGMFKVAKDTAQGFDTVAEAATELARQGLGMEKTLMRTKDALILTRLTGMNAADAVKSLTAAVNSFNKEGVTSAQVINRMAKVDAAFAVSSEDLAKSISRVGASAVSAGVSMNELLAITTAVQQRTARGGAVIGNAFKTIFTRIQRSDVQKQLKNFGIATTNMSGKMLDGMKVMQNLANGFDGLSKSQQAFISENVAGVFQVNILKAALADLSQETSVYKGALRAAGTATDEAYQKNEKLNKTLDSLVNRTLANLTQAGASLGGGLFGPAIENALGVVNKAIEAFGKDGIITKVGGDIGKNLLAGIGSFIGGPGLVAITAVFGKLALSLGKFATTALKDIVGVNAATKQRAALEEVVVATIAKEPALLQKVKAGTLNVLTVERDILATIRQQQAERKALAAYGGGLATSLYARGTRVGSSGSAFMPGFGGRPGRASGFVPNFANPNAERVAAAAGGYTAGAIKTMSQPGAGTMMYNSAETVKQFPGMSQKAIMPPQGSPAGAAYKSAFGSAHGFNPYAAGGFVPNFAPTRSGMPKNKNKISRSPNYLRQYQIDASDIGVILGLADGKVPKQKNYLLKSEGIRGNVGLRTKAPKLHKALVDEKASIKLNGVRIESFINTAKEDQAEAMFEGILSKELKSGTGNIAKRIMTRFGIEGAPGNMGKLPPGLQGEVFEESMRMAMKAAVATPGADFDFEAGRPPSAALQKIFGQPVFRIDAKRRLKSAGKGEITKKYFNDPQTGKHGISLLNIMRGDLVGGKPKALGFVPNFSPLSGAIGREMAAGVPASAIRVGSSNSLRSSGNPSGLGVYNTIHEPQGLQQGIKRSKSMGINPKSHGVPNFASIDLTDQIGTFDRKEGKFINEQQKMHKESMKEARATRFAIAGSLVHMASGAVANSYGMESGVGKGAHVMGNVASMAGMGMMLGPKGAIVGGIAGLVMGLATIPKAVDPATEALKKQIDVQGMLKAASEESAEAMAKLTSATPAEFVQTKETLLAKYAANESLTGTKAFDKLMGAQNSKQAIAAMRDLDNIVKTQTIVAGGIQGIKKAGTVYGTSQNLIEQRRERNRGRGSMYKQFTPLGISGLDTGTSREEAALFTLLDSLGKGMGMEGLKGGVQGAVQVRDNLMNRAAAAGVDKADMSSLRGMAPEQALATMTGLDAGALEPLLEELDLFSDEGRARFNQFLTDFLGDAESFEAAVKKLKAAVDAQAKDVGERRDLYGPLLATIESSTVVFEGIKSAAKLSHDSIMQEVAARRQSLQLDQQLQASKVSMQKTEEEIIKQRHEDAKNTIKANKENDDEIARSKRQLAIETIGSDAALNAANELAKLIKSGKIAQGGAVDAGKGLTQQNSMGFTVASLANDPENLKRFISQKSTRLRELRVQSGVTMGGLGADEGAELAMLEAIIPKLRTLTLEEFRAKQLSTQKAEEESGLAEKRFQLQLQNYKNSYEINKRERQRVRERTLTLNKLKELEARELAGAGKLGAKGVADAYRTKIDSQIAAEGIGKVDVGGVLGQTFRNEMAYNQVDAFRDFRDGVSDVAGTMKSSFAQAFQSISTGATTVQGALANMAQGILNSINQMSTQIFSNMMFAKMFPTQAAGTTTAAHGGYIPGYAGGGLVTGGSGYKDDILTKMQGGEFVIKKSAVNKIGVGNLNAINGYANGGQTGQSGGGPSMAAMGALAVGSGALMGIMGAASADRPEKYRGRDYGLGRGALGPLGGADRDAGRVDSVGGGGTSANVSLAKGFVYYRRDPETGKLISERARPTEGRFEVSDSLSLMGRLAESDPQTARMFDKEQRLGTYINQIQDEKASRKAQIQAVKDQKRSRTIGAFMNAGMLIGGAKLFQHMNKPTGAEGGGIPQYIQDPSLVGPRRADGSFANGGRNSGSLARVMGGEYVMSPQAVRTHGVGFMTELNRGNVPGYADGGLVGGGGGSTLNTGGNTTNNVKINVNIDKNGGAEAEVGAGSGSGKGKSEGTEENQEIQNNAKFGEMLKGVVLEEIVKQQRPGGLLSNQN